MAKYYGLIGFAEPNSDERPGITFDEIKEYPYYGEVLRNARRVTGTDKVNDDLTVSNQISLLLDPYLEKNYYNIRYLTYMGAKWKVTNIEMRYPRMIVDIGGLYVEQETGNPSEFM